MVRGVILMVGAAMLLGGGVRTQATSLHDIPWYMTNTAARAATIKLCRSDNRFARDTDCANAESAEDRLYGLRAARAAGAAGHGRGQLFDDVLLSPSYWAQNKLARIGVVASCQHPPTTFAPDVCAAAQQADILARGQTAGR